MSKPFAQEATAPYTEKQKSMVNKHCHRCGVPLPIIGKKYYCLECSKITTAENKRKHREWEKLRILRTKLV